MTELTPSCCDLNGLAVCGWKPTTTRASLFENADVAKEMLSLSLEEREKAMDDLHGVAKVQQETPEFVDECVRAMNVALAKFPPKKKKDYTRALFLWPGLKDDTKFKLRFLRADSYDAKKAAKRMIRYYAEKRELFGEEKLVKTITIDDLSDADIEEFSSGTTLELPIKDQSGRPIVFYDDLPVDIRKINLDSTARSLWYNFMTVFDDETAQIKGAVGINRICVGADVLLNPTWIREQLELDSAIGEFYNSVLPGRFSSFHLCIDSPHLGLMVSSARLAMGKSTRLRLRVHIGSDMENEYSLMTFGIPFEGVLQSTREGSNELHLKYIQRRREIDRQKIASEFQECVRTGFVPFPTQSDVLFGRGRPYRDFPGNDLWNRVIDDHFDNFRSGKSRFEKTCVTMDVVKKVRNSSNIRFLLESTDGGWKMVLSDVSLREKASAALQNRGKALSRAESHEPGTESVAKRPRYESSKLREDEESVDLFEPLPLY